MTTSPAKPFGIDVSPVDKPVLNQIVKRLKWRYGINGSNFGVLYITQGGAGADGFGLYM